MVGITTIDIWHNIFGMDMYLFLSPKTYYFDDIDFRENIAY